MKLQAGSKSELLVTTHPWVILDIGFSQNKSCGLILGSCEPICLNFGETCRAVADWINHQNSPINLMIEAPLSMAFDLKDNPVPRKVEKLGSITRPWYSGPGATVLVAAIHLIAYLRDRCPDASIVLFEGFVSFKPREGKSDHRWDANRLSESVRSGPSASVEFWDEADLRADGTTLMSVFVPCGFNPGIPAIVRVLG